MRRWPVFLSMLSSVFVMTGITGCPPPPDNDGDGYTTTDDCNDEDATVHPGATELCNGVDDNCDGIIPDDEVVDVNGVMPCAVVAENEVGSDGGSVVVDDPSSPVYGLEVEIPAGALSTTENIQVVINDIPPTLPTGFTQVGTAVQLEPAGIVFAQPVFLHVPWATSSTDESLVVGHYSDTTGTWTALPLWGVDEESRTVTLTDSFSTFAGLAFLVGDSVITSFLPENNGFLTINRAVIGAEDGSCWGYALYANWYWNSGQSAQKVLSQAYSLPTNTVITVAAEAAQGTVDNAWARVLELINPLLFPTDLQTLATVVSNLRITGDPQVVLLKNGSGGKHAVLAIGWDSNNVLIYDPNYPAVTKKILWNGFNFDAYNGYDSFIAANIEPIVSYDNMVTVYMDHDYDGPTNTAICSQSVEYLYDYAVYENAANVTLKSSMTQEEALYDCEFGTSVQMWIDIKMCVQEYTITGQIWTLDNCLNDSYYSVADYDYDGDGFTENQGDCDDNDLHRYPDAVEICGDGVDQDCDEQDTICVEAVTWNKTFGGSCEDFANSVQQTSDGGYIVAGFTCSYGTQTGDVWLLKISRAGVEDWSRTFGGNSTGASFVQQTSDGGYIISGNTYAYGAGGEDFWLIKTDDTGIEQWNRTFGGASDDHVYSMQQTNDGGYVMAGYTKSYGAGGEDFWLIKTDSQGIQEWERTFGGSGSDYAYSVRQTTDGGYIVAGQMWDYQKSFSDSFVLKISATGVEQWNWTLGESIASSAEVIQQTTDGGYIIVISTWTQDSGSMDIWLINIDSSGVEQWSQKFGFSNAQDDYASSVQQTADGGYILGGWSESTANSLDALLIKTTGTGAQEWSKTFGGSSFEYAKAVRQTTDGGYIVAGYTEDGVDYSSVWLIKTDANGNAPATPQ